MKRHVMLKWESGGWTKKGTAKLKRGGAGRQEKAEGKRGKAREKRERERENQKKQNTKKRDANTHAPSGPVENGPDRRAAGAPPPPPLNPPNTLPSALESVRRTSQVLPQATQGPRLGFRNGQPAASGALPSCNTIWGTAHYLKQEIHARGREPTRWSGTASTSTWCRPVPLRAPLFHRGKQKLHATWGSKTDSAQRGESCRGPAFEGREAGQLQLEVRARLQPLSFSTVVAARAPDPRSPPAWVCGASERKRAERPTCEGVRRLPARAERPNRRGRRSFAWWVRAKCASWQTEVACKMSRESNGCLQRPKLVFGAARRRAAEGQPARAERPDSCSSRRGTLHRVANSLGEDVAQITVAVSLDSDGCKSARSIALCLYKFAGRQKRKKAGRQKCEGIRVCWRWPKCQTATTRGAALCIALPIRLGWTWHSTPGSGVPENRAAFSPRLYI